MRAPIGRPHDESSTSDRRRFLRTSLAAVALSAVTHRAFAAGVDPVVAAAREGLARFKNHISHRDVVGVADFALPSRSPRFHLVDLVGGKVETLLVAHGCGSDPEQTGWLRSFSNRPDSEATSQGHYLTGGYYVGEHGRSMRLQGLEPTNSNAVERRIVVHSAWYVGTEVVRERGKLGRSEGCFAVSRNDLSKVLDRLGPGRLLLAAKL